MTIAQQKTSLRFLTFSIDISCRLVITWQHKYQVHPTDSLNICHLITILVLSSSIQSRQMSWGGALRDDPNNGCEGDYLFYGGNE